MNIRTYTFFCGIAYQTKNGNQFSSIGFKVNYVIALFTHLIYYLNNCMYIKQTKWVCTSFTDSGYKLHLHGQLKVVNLKASVICFFVSLTTGV